MKGVDTTVGFIAWCNQPAEYDSEMTKILRENGAVIHCKTNVPTAMVRVPDMALVAKGTRRLASCHCSVFPFDCTAPTVEFSGPKLRAWHVEKCRTTFCRV